MANTSPEVLAQSILDDCLADRDWSRDDAAALVDSGSPALFRVLAEGLSDRFDPRLSDAYAAIFAFAIARTTKRHDETELLERYHRVRRRSTAYRREPRRIVLLSRVTLGADIVVTSIVAQALQSRFPGVPVALAGPAKSAELLGLPSFAIDYPRAEGLSARIAAVRTLAGLDEETLLVDPDSRLSQLGMLPLAPERNYLFFESRRARGEGTLSDLAREWCRDVFEVDIPWTRMAVAEPPFRVTSPAIAVSLGTGGNSAKRIEGAFERDLLRELGSRAAMVILDKGVDPEEAVRADAAAAGLKNVRLWNGSFSAFAALIAQSNLYVGYDSAGQHAATALGIPVVSVFAGAVNDRFFARWRTAGRVIRVDGGSPESVLLRVRSALPDLYPASHSQASKNVTAPNF